MKHFKIQLLFNPKKYSSYEQYPKNIDSWNSTPPKNILIPVCKYTKSTPWWLASKGLLNIQNYLLLSEGEVSR